MSDFDKSVVGGRVREEASVDVGLRNYMNSVFGYMGTGLLISALVAYGLGLRPDIIYTLKSGMMGWIVMLAPIIMIFSFGAAARKMSANGALMFFYAISAALGVSMSSIFIRYESVSILTTFLTTAVAFGGLALFGYTTKRDLSPMGRFLIMGLIGIIIASIINMFVHSGAANFAISVLGVLIFAGFTAYDTQNIKNTYLQYRHSLPADEMKKVGIFGALNLYLDFVNLFSFMLHFMGDE